MRVILETMNWGDLIVFWDISNESGIDLSYDPDFMEMDETYKHNIEILLTFTYGVQQESICNKK